jgi:hypothetical protein
MNSSISCPSTATNRSSHDREPALLEHSNRPDVVLGSTRIQRANFYLCQELLKRTSGKPIAPVLPSDPVTDLRLIISPEMGDVADDVAVRDYSPGLDGRSTQALVQACHMCGVELMSKEVGEVLGDFPQRDVDCHDRALSLASM